LTTIPMTAPAVALPRTRQWLLRILGPLLVTLFASLFVVALYESWWALHDAAVSTGIPDPRPWPWMVDGFILAMALMVVHAKQLGLRRLALWGPRAGLVAATCLSTGIQAAWAPATDYAFTLHAWSPLAVLFSFECLIRLLYGAPTSAAAAVRDGPPGEAAVGAPEAAGSLASSQVSGAPPPDPVRTAEASDSADRSLPDRGTPVTVRDQTVTPAFTQAEIAVLYRQRRNPDGFRAKVAEKGFDPDAAWALAAARGWPVAASGNGHREQVPA
jgi:hypothetical protein